MEKKTTTKGRLWKTEKGKKNVCGPKHSEAKPRRDTGGDQHTTGVERTAIAAKRGAGPAARQPGWLAGEKQNTNAKRAPTLAFRTPRQALYD